MNTLIRNERPATERPVQYLTPPANIFETKDGYVLECEMPGVNKDGLEVTVEGTELTISGRRPEVEKKGDVVFRESRPLDFRRIFELDPTINVGKIQARMEQGVLTLTLPKAEEVKPKKIKVTD
jgi:HSP20 family protein